MGKLLDALNNYLEDRTPEQIKEDNKLVEKYQNCGPTVEEYFENLLNSTDNDEIKEICKDFLKSTKH